MHPRSRRWNVLGYVLVRRQEVLVTKTIRDADVWMDHRLFISQMRLLLQPRQKPQGRRPPSDKAKRAARKSPAPETNTVDAKALPTCPHWQRIFRAQISLVGHPWTQFTNNLTSTPSTSNSANPPSDSPTLTPGINSIAPTIIETTSQCSSSVIPTTANTTNVTISTNTSDVDSILSCPQCDRTFTSHIGLVGHLRIYRTETE
ncbi:unnamed protein product [Schistocephalus solidus]|uniref:C2H2-type domain-containing protein n=1 Tax=Schistocephalus solidus TaxID=70667 RepID=A0A183TFM8_SCHSO|nr:unnamed protein product [Schistocephalus solidus]